MECIYNLENIIFQVEKFSDEQFKALFHFLNQRDTFACLAAGHEKSLIYHTAVLVARKVKILPSNPTHLLWLFHH